MRLLLVLAMLAFAGSAQACIPQKRAELPLRLRDGFPLVPARIAGTPVTLLLDTGAQGNLLTPEAAAALALPVDPGRTTSILGTGGATTAPNVILRGLSLGGVAMPDQSTPVAPLPGAPTTDPPLAGLLGAPLLSAFDLELDVPGGRLALWSATGCEATPMPGPVSALPLEVSPLGEAFLPVQVNGHTLLALLDTGSRSTILTEAAAARLGLHGDIAASTARGVDGRPTPLRFVRLRELQVGAEVSRDVPVSVSALQLEHGDMLLGLDYLGRRRAWVSYSTGRVLIGPALR